jgi:hypothetical protein
MPQVMSESYNVSLVAGAALSAVAALLHLGIIVGGPSWYRFFGAGERFASAAAAGRWWPNVFTLGIACVLGLWAAYALSGAGVIAPLPLLKLALVLITGVYLLRGLVLVPALIVTRGKVSPFAFWSSVICLGYGAFHLLGLVQVWHRLPLQHGI